MTGQYNEQVHEVVANARAPQAPEYCTSGVVTIIVGPDRKKYEVHKQLLSAKSKFFDGCIKQDFSEAQKNEINLPDDDETVFEVVLHWLYHGTIPDVRGEVFAQVYALGDRLMMTTTFKNDFMDSVLSRLQKERHVIPTLLRECLDSDIPENRLYDFVLATLVWSLAKEPQSWLEDERLKTSLHSLYVDERAVAAVMTTMLKWHVKPYREPRFAGACHYHDHSDGSTCK